MTMTPEQKEILIRNYVAERLFSMTQMDIEEKCAALMVNVLLTLDDEQLMILELI
jgi:hypothetical protein